MFLACKGANTYVFIHTKRCFFIKVNKLTKQNSGLCRPDEDIFRATFSVHVCFRNFNLFRNIKLILFHLIFNDFPTLKTFLDLNSFSKHFFSFVCWKHFFVTLLQLIFSQHNSYILSEFIELIPTVSFADLDLRWRDDYFCVSFDHFWHELRFLTPLVQ